MWVNLILVGISSLLLAYWFRYTCLLILSARKVRDYASPVARANALSFPEIQRVLADAQSAAASNLDALHRALDRDYRLLTCLLRHGAEYRVVARNVESRMLMLDFQLMRARYAFSRRTSTTRGREALTEMVSIVRHFADAIGESAA